MRLLAGTIFDRQPHCERCERPESECQCPPETTQPTVAASKRQTVRMSIEKRKKGKLVTVIRGLAATDHDLPALLTQLKNACGAGGSIDGDLIELQGDQIERLKKSLGQWGYTVR